jgi:hypothetical protein
MKYGIHLFKLPTATTRTDGTTVHQNIVHILNEADSEHVMEYYSSVEGKPFVFDKGAVERDYKSHSAWREAGLKQNLKDNNQLTKQYRSRLTKRKAIR